MLSSEQKALGAQAAQHMDRRKAGEDHEHSEVQNIGQNNCSWLRQEGNNKYRSYVQHVQNLLLQKSSKYLLPLSLPPPQSLLKMLLLLSVTVALLSSQHALFLAYSPCLTASIWLHWQLFSAAKK